jgi:quercetin dioxygenase-like cupin family protein
MLNLKITKLENAPQVPFKFDGRIMFSSDQLELIHLSLKPGEKMEPHSQPFDVVFYVLAGNGILELAAQSVDGTPGTCIQIPAGMQRGWKNSGNDEFRILVVKDLK